MPVKIETGKYTLTPQIILFIDVVTKKTIKEQVLFDVEWSKKFGDMSNDDIKEILFLLKKRNMPFLEIPPNIAFDSKLELLAKCNSYSITVSKLKSDPYDNARFEFQITASLSRI